MLTKEFNVKYQDDGNGTLEGYASTWVRKPDSYGDIVAEGAFKNSLETRWNGGKGIPLLWSHQMDNVDAFIGTADADEDEKGLHFIAKFDNTEKAQRVRELYKDGRLRKFSFAYDVKEQGMTTSEDGTKSNELRELDLYEISCVTVPANDTAEVIDVKGRNDDADNDLSALEARIKAIEERLDTDDDGEDDPEDNPAGEDRKESNPKVKELLEYIEKMEVK